MPAIPRHTQKIFGQSLTPSGNVAVYGSLAAGAPTYPATTDDLTTIQSAAWLLGLNSALIGNRSPALEDLNGLFVVLSQQIAYLLQNGIAEWDATTTYYVGNLARIPGTATVCTSLTNNNVGNNPASNTNDWSASGSSYPAVASTAGAQTVDTDSVSYLLSFANSEYDPQGRYNIGASRYTAPVPGAYRISANLQVDNASGPTNQLELSLTAVKNGVSVARAAGASVSNPPGNRWYPQLDTVVVLAAGDTIQMHLMGVREVAIGEPFGSVTVSNSDWSISKLP